MVYNVLIVDDDVKLALLVKTYFEKEGFHCIVTHEGASVIALIREKKPDIVILDIMLPGMDGWEICRRLRKESDIPIIMLTSRDEETDRLIGLEIGADDYVTKPFSPREVVARAKAIFRRMNKPAKPVEFFQFGELELNLTSYQLKKAERIIELTPTEFKILELFCVNSGRVLSRLQIVEQVQGYAFDGYERTIDAHVKNLRRKIEDNPKEPDYIQTVYGVGYRFVAEEAE